MDKSSNILLNEFIAEHKLTQAKEFDHMLVGLDKQQIVFMRYKTGAQMDLSCAQKVVDYTAELGNKKPLVNIIELAPGCGIKKEASVFSKSEEANLYTLADAIIVKNNVQRILGNVYMNFGNTTRPTKLFTSTPEAKNWLQQFQ